jgi:hypothetical protein
MLAVVQHQQGDLVGHRLDEDLVDAPSRLLGDSGGLGNSPGYRFGIRQRRQLNQPGAIGEAVHDVVRKLDGQARLPDASQSNDADNALRPEQRAESRPLLGSTDEAGPPEWQVVADDTDQAQRRESVAKVLVTELEQALGLGEPTQLIRPEGDQGRPDGQATLDGDRRGLR